MALPDLHLFVEDLNKRPGRGNFGPPRTIKAKDLDDNYKKTTLLEGEGEPKLYEVEYTDDGTRITRILPETPDNGTYVLGVIDGTIQWIATEDCGEEEE